MEQDDVGDGQCVARLADMLVRSYRRLNRKVNLARKRDAGFLCVMLRPSPFHRHEMHRGDSKPVAWPT